MRAFYLFVVLLSISFAASSQEDVSSGNSKWTYGIKCQFTNLEPSVNGLARASDNRNLWGFVNDRGEWVIKPTFTSCTNFDRNNLSKVSVIIKGVGIRYGFIDRSGKMVIAAQYPSLGSFQGGYAIAQARNGLFGMIDTKGTWVINPTFEALNNFQQGLAKAQKKNKVGLIDLSGEWIIPPMFEDIKMQGKNSALVKKNGLWGVVHFTRTYK